MIFIPIPLPEQVLQTSSCTICYTSLLYKLSWAWAWVCISQLDFSVERQESLQNIADFYFSVERQEAIGPFRGPLFRAPPIVSLYVFIFVLKQIAHTQKAE